MKIKFYFPFNEKLGRNLVELNIEGEITLSQFSRILVERFPALQDFLTGDRSSDFLNAIFFVARRGTILSPGDIVMDQDELEIIAPIVGG